MTTGVRIQIPTPKAMRDLGVRIGALCRGGDVVILKGELAAGKTTLTQGIAYGLGIDDAVTSPTFVIARVHVNPSGRPNLVHVDAYRLRSAFELDDLDVDSDLDTSVVVVEWGDGVADRLSGERLHVDIQDDGTDVRLVELTASGARWQEPIATIPGVTT